MSSGWTASALLRSGPTVDGIETLRGLEPLAPSGGSGFAGRPPHPRRDKVKNVPPAGFEPAASAFGGPRASAALRGHGVRAEGFEPPQTCNRVTAGPDSPTSAHPLGVAAGTRTRTTRATTWRAHPVHHSHRARRRTRTADPRRVKAVLSQLSYPSVMPYAVSESNRPRPVHKTGPTDRVGSGATLAEEVGFEPTRVRPLRRFQRRVRNQPAPLWLSRQDSNLHRYALTVRCPTELGDGRTVARGGLEPALPG
jgi:hypothetical protein